MSKYDAFVYEYLTEHKQVGLEKIGTLTLQGHLPQVDRDNPHPSMNHLVQFESNKRATTTPELIDFIAAKLQKNKSLVYSDVESYFEQVRQFINIGKPYIIPGVGGIHMAKNGAYEFNGSETLPTALVNREGQPKQEPAFETSEERRTDLRATQQNMLKYLAMGLGVLLLAGLGYFIYSFTSDIKADNAELQEQPVNADTAATNDSLMATTPIPAATDSVTLRLNVYQSPYAWTANKKVDSMNRAGLFAALDSSGEGRQKRFTVVLETKAGSMADTTAVIDSMSRQFKRPVSLMPQ